MASSGPNSPSTAVNDASIGSVAWTSPTNALSSNNSYATAAITGNTTNYLKVTNFGFAIPAGATIDGIVVEVERKELSTFEDIVDAAIRIVKGGTIGATDKSNGTEWPTTDTYRTYGGAADLWGETWTADDINLSTFGFAMAATSAMSGSPSVDHIRITVHYTEGGGGRSRMTMRLCG